MKTDKHVHFRNYIKAERKLMTFGGLYPLKETKYKAFHTLSAIFIVTITSTYNLLGLTHGFQHISNVAMFSELVTYLLLGISFSCKIINLFLHKNNLLLLDDILQNPILTKIETLEEETILKSKLNFGQILKKSYKLYVAITVIVQVLYTFLNNSGHTNFPVLLWFPFNPEDHYYKIFFVEALMIITISIFNATVVLLNALFMDLCAAQFELLKYRLKHLGWTVLGEGTIDERIIYNKLNKIVIYQNYVYRCSKLVEETFSVGAFCQLAFTGIVLCCGIFTVVIVPIKSKQFLKMAAYCFYMTLEISLYCCYGQKVLDASSTVTEACFMSNWYNCSATIQNHLVIIMNRANKPVEMKAGGLILLTLETLMSIWNSAYSFFTLLIQIYNQDN